jgi:hypothetical protein
MSQCFLRNVNRQLILSNQVPCHCTNHSKAWNLKVKSQHQDQKVNLCVLVEARLHYALSFSVRHKSLIGVSSLPLYLLDNSCILNTRPGEVMDKDYMKIHYCLWGVLDL